MDVFVDFSLGSNGDGTTGTPHNTLVDIGAVKGDKVWVRRGGTLLITDHLQLVSGVDYYGYPGVGDIGYSDRPVVAGWDADAIDAPTIRSEGVPTLRIWDSTYTGLFNFTLYNNHTQWAIDLKSSRYCSIINCTTDLTHANGGHPIKTSAVYNVTIDRLTVNVFKLTGGLFYLYSFGESTIMATINVQVSKAVWSDTLYYMSSCRTLILDIKVVMADANMEVFSLGASSSTGSEIDANLEIVSSHPDSTVYISTTSIYSVLRVRAPSVYMPPNSSTSTAVAGKVYIETDQLRAATVTSIPPLHTTKGVTVYIKHRTPGAVIDIVPGTRGSGGELTAGGRIHIEKCARMRVDHYVARVADACITWTDEDDVWHIQSGDVKGSTSSVSRVGGGGGSLRMVGYNSKASPGTLMYPLYVGLDTNDLIQIPLVAGTHTITSFVAFRDLGAVIPMGTVSQIVVWTINNYPHTKTTAYMTTDDSVWTGDPDVNSYKISTEVVLAEDTDVYVRYIVQLPTTPHLPKQYGYIDLTPVVT